MEITEQCNGYKILKGNSLHIIEEFDYDLQCHELDWKRQKTINDFLQKLISHANEHAKERLNNGRIEAGVCNLTKNDLITIWNKQNGKCFYSGIQMTPESCSNWMCSLERLNDDKGYTIDNVVLICFEFNNGVKWTLDKVKQISLLVNDQSNDTSLLQEIDDALNKRRWKASRKIITRNEAGDYICNHCNIYKPISEFYTHINKGCKDCQKLSRKLNKSTIRGHLQQLVSNAKQNSARRNDTTFDIIFGIYFKATTWKMCLF